MRDDPRILIIRPSALGDVCRTVPVLASLRRAFPHATIHWVVQDTFVDAVSAHPALDAPVPFPRRELSRALRRGRPEPIYRFFSGLRRERYDLVLDCQGLARSGLMAWATRAPSRVGYRNAQEHAALAYTRRIDAPRAHHTVDRMLALVEGLGLSVHRDMRLFAPLADQRAVAAERDASAGPEPIIVAPTSRWAGKRWPIERFGTLCDVLLQRAPHRLILVGGPDERGQCAPLLQRAGNDPRVVDRVGRTSVGGLMAEIERSSLVIACDSAPLHMAVGFGVPTVALFGPTDASRVGPYQRDHEVLQHLRPGDRFDHKDEPHGRAMMERITTEEVIERSLAAISRSSARTPS